MSAAKKTEGPQLLDKFFELGLEVNAKSLNQVYDSIKDTKEKLNLHLNFSKTKTLENSCYPIVYKIKNTIVKNGGDFSSTGFDPKIQLQLQTDGVVALFNIKNQKQEKKKIDANFINPFITSAMNTFNIQANISIQCGTPKLKVAQGSQVDIVGVMSLVSDYFEGSISLCFPQSSFLNVCNQLFGENHTEINPEIEDAAGELLNMIFGAAKAELNKKYDYQIQKSLPTIISGQSLKLKQSKGPTIVLPFSSDAGPFHLEIEVVEK